MSSFDNIQSDELREYDEYLDRQAYLESEEADYEEDDDERADGLTDDEAEAWGDTDDDPSEMDFDPYAGCYESDYDDGRYDSDW